MATGYDAYNHNSVQTASPEQLVVMLFDGAIRFSRRALQAYELGDFGAASASIGRVSAIVGELNSTLDMDAGGEIAQNLRSLYTFLARHLLEAATRRDPSRVRQSLSILSELREGFAHASRTVKAA